MRAERPGERPDGSGIRNLLVLGREEPEVGPEREDRRVRLRVPEDLMYFRGHFEGDPILAGVVQLDSAVLAEVEVAWPELEGRLRRVSRLKFVAPVRPGDDLLVRLSRSRALGRVDFSIERRGVPCTSGTLTFDEPAGT